MCVGKSVKSARVSARDGVFGRSGSQCECVRAYMPLCVSVWLCECECECVQAARLTP